MHATLYIAANSDWRKVRNLFLAVCLVCATAQSQADTWLNTGGVSKHFSAQQFNESNPGLGIETDALGLTFAAGVFTNSLGTSSRYAVVEQKFLTKGNFSIGALAGVIDGYHLNGGNVFPIVVPTLRYDGAVFGVRALLIPQIGDTVAPAIALQLRLKISR